MNPKQTDSLIQHLPVQASERPDLSIERVQRGMDFPVTSESMPWIAEDTTVRTVLLKLESGQELYYGSMASENNTIRHLSAKVPAEKSKQAEAGLFKAMPGWLDGRDHPNIDVIAGMPSDRKYYKVAKPGKDAARLLFIVENHEGVPVVLKVGIARHKDQDQMINAVRGSTKRRKRE